MNPIIRLAALVAALAATGCTLHYSLVELPEADVDRARTASRSPYACVDGHDPLELRSARPTKLGAPVTAEGSRRYLFGPAEDPGTKLTPPPLRIAGSVLVGAGGPFALMGALAFVPCIDDGECPGWIAPAAWTGLGLAIVGAVFLIVQEVDDKAGTRPVPHRIEDLGRGKVCDGD